MLNYLSTKTYGHEVGLTACFRQHRAKSHCRYLHGYALKFRFEFEAARLDENGWVVDFGSLKPLKDALADQFDHCTLVAEDDPELDTFKNLALLKIIQLRVVRRTGCEAFATMALHMAQELVPQARVRACEVWEHGANSARVEA